MASRQAAGIARYLLQLFTRGIISSQLREVELPFGKFSGLIGVGAVTAKHRDYCITHLPWTAAAQFPPDKLYALLQRQPVPEYPEIYQPVRMPELRHHDMPCVIRVANQQWRGNREQVCHGVRGAQQTVY